MNSKKEQGVEVPELSAWVASIARKSTDQVVRETPKSISQCFDHQSNILRRYPWRRIDSDSFTKLMNKQKSVVAMNRLFWGDQISNANAYGIMSYWRGLELLGAAVQSLNTKQVVAAAVLARSALELASALLLNANTIEKTLNCLDFDNQTFIGSEEFEKIVNKMIWGTRLGEHEPHLSQKNILSYIQKLSKHPDLGELLAKYEYLCELAHPNVVGNARFWSEIAETTPDGSEVVIVTPAHDRGFVSEIAETTLWAVSQSAVWIRNGQILIQLGVQATMAKLWNEKELH